ncbi:Ribokinase [Cichlidogyrus casuarinus]|uniref:Ribokinase n=1 Tax=Cichlidogyrus casuarinus TaxID=1844966 RepID=A0ABD2QC97_9PLAT
MAKHFAKKTSPYSGERILVVGGSNIDRTIRVTHEGVSSIKDLHPPGSFRGEVLEQSSGGVGRNMAQVLHKLGTDCGFLTAVQPHDQQSLLEDIPHQLAEVDTNDRTACYIGVLNEDNELLFGVADMSIHEKIGPESVKSFLSKRLSHNPKVVLFDLNIPSASVEEIIRFSQKNQLETWCEPTDHHKFEKLFHLIDKQPDLAGLSLVAPNEHEFRKLVAWKIGKKALENSEEIVNQARSMLDFAHRFLIKRAEKGIIYVDADAAFEMSSPIQDEAEISSVSGAGDSLLAAVLYARHHLGLRNWESCLLIGLKAAEMSMRTHASVPDQWNVEEFREKHINDWALSRNIQIKRF